MELFPEYDPNMITEFLVSRQLCERLDPEIIKLTNLKPKRSGANSAISELYFFPALMSYNQRPQLYNSETNITRPFQFGWCLHCFKQHHFFSSRFLHLLILRLAYQNARPTLHDNPHNLSCHIWSTGVSWCTPRNVECLVEVVNDSKFVIFLASSDPGCEDSMIAYRRIVIQEILSIRRMSCSSIEVKECIIDPMRIPYPIDDPKTLVLYHVQQIADSIAHRHEGVVSCSRNGIQKKLSIILPFEYDKGKLMSIFVRRDTEVMIIVMHNTHNNNNNIINYYTGKSIK